MRTIKAAIIGTRDLQDLQAVHKYIETYCLAHDIKMKFIASGNSKGTDQVANLFLSEDTHVAHYLPWPNFNKENFITHKNMHYILRSDTNFDEKILELFPHMKKVSTSVWHLIRRNFQIILGIYGDKPVDIVFWYTKDGKITGGTRYGVLLAQHLGIKTVQITI